MKVTIKDIAKRAGVSDATVSRALNNSAMVNSQTRARVMQVAQELQYQYTEHARAPRQDASSKVIGVIVPDLRTPFYPDVLIGIEDYAYARGYQTMICCTYRNPEKDVPSVQALISCGIRGLIVAPNTMRSLLVMRDAAGKLPFVCSGMFIDDETIPFVSTDMRAAAFTATEYLIQIGHRKICFIGGNRDTIPMALRLDGFGLAIERYGMAEGMSRVIESPVTHAGGYNATMKLIQSGDMPTAIIAINDTVALGVFEALKDNNLHVPDDVSILSFDNSEISAYSFFNLTTMSQPQYDIGKAAAGMLFGMIDGTTPAGSSQHVLLESSLIIRKSCASVARGE
nr:LacI family DNA-binding transcriptional regulator [Maliibacterium massiliense]